MSNWLRIIGGRRHWVAILVASLMMTALQPLGGAMAGTHAMHGAGGGHMAAHDHAMAPDCCGDHSATPCDIACAAACISASVMMPAAAPARFDGGQRLAHRAIGDPRLESLLIGFLTPPPRA